MKINLPNGCKRIRIDIGLAGTAPNTYAWSQELEDCFIIAIEPIERNLRCSTYFVPNSQKNNNILWIQGAIDDVERVERRNMYVTKKDNGCSSLYQPVEFEVSREEEVGVASLSTILSSLDWGDLEYVEYLKIDTQGNDLQVLKSAGEFLDKVAMLEVECTTHGDYHNAPTEIEIIEFLNSRGFSLHKNCEDSYVNGTYVDRMFYNNKFESMRNNIKTDFQPATRWLKTPQGMIRANVFVEFHGDELANQINLSSLKNLLNLKDYYERTD